MATSATAVLAMVVMEPFPLENPDPTCLATLELPADLAIERPGAAAAQYLFHGPSAEVHNLIVARRLAAPRIPTLPYPFASRASMPSSRGTPRPARALPKASTA